MNLLDPSLLGGIISGLATIATGLLAIFIFKTQKKDEKINAAISILTEIRNAENQIANISEKVNSNNTIDLPSILQTNSWKKSSHLFAKDLDEDELKLINRFYSSCEIIEDLINRQNNFVWVAAEERAKTTQKLLAKNHVEFQREVVANGKDVEVARKTFEAIKKGITEYYTEDDYFYAPVKTSNGLKLEITKFTNLTITTCGAKLKKIATS